MSNTVINAQNLSKRYRLGLKEKQSETLAGQLGNLIKSPWDNLKRLRNMSRFGGEDESVFWALKDVSFEVKKGEVLGIIGKNGAGKSTLLKILSGITDPTSGRIEIHGRVASLLEVGTGFHPELSGRENIYMNGTILGMSRREIDSKLEEIIHFSGVEKFIDTPVKFYSSGMKVRLGFSVAAHLDPEILIIDEVLAVGDYEFQKKCLGKMEDVSRNQGRTVIFVSHNLAALASLTSRSILLENGILKKLDLSENVISDYVSSSSRISSLNLNDRKDREGLGNAKITHISISNDGNVVVGEKLEVFLKFQSFNLKEPITEIGISIWDKFESRIISLSSKFKNEINYFNESEIICCKVPSLMLVEGVYFLNAFISSSSGIQDYILNVGKINVIDLDYFGNGERVNPNWGLIVVEHSWKILL